MCGGPGVIGDGRQLLSRHGEYTLGVFDHRPNLRVINGVRLTIRDCCRDGVQPLFRSASVLAINLISRGEDERPYFVLGARDCGAISV